MANLYVIVLLAAISLGVCGQLFLKHGMLRVGEVELRPKNLVGTVLRIFRNAYVLVGASIFGLSTLLWLMAISRLDLSFAYPMVSLSYVLTAFLSRHFFKEEIKRRRWLSIALICTGVIIVSLS